MFRKAIPLALFAIVSVKTGQAASVTVEHIQGATRGFLTIRSESGAFLATGDLTQLATGNRVTSKLVFTFRDGSIDEEAATYSQSGSFKTIRDHHVQRGPFFPQLVDMLVEHGTDRSHIRGIKQ